MTIRAGPRPSPAATDPPPAPAARLAAAAADPDQANASRKTPLRHSPLRLTTDEEGGLVRRLPGAPDESEKQSGEAARPALAAKAAGRGAGQNLTGAGLNVNLAP